MLALLRISQAPSAAADALAGLALAHGAAAMVEGGLVFGPEAWAALPAQLGASLGVYHGALALNDWRDREHDRRTRPTRPIPSGAVPPWLAFLLGSALVLGGVSCASTLGPTATTWTGVIALLALLYTFVARGPVAGPALLGACRGANLASPAVQTGAWSEPLVLAASLVYALYVACISKLGRHEDGVEQDASGLRQRLWLGAATASLLCAAVVGWLGKDAWLPRIVAAALATGAAGGLARHLVGATLADPSAVQGAMGDALRRMLPLLAVLVLAVALDHTAWIVAGCILAGLPLAWLLRRVAPPT
ncbi:MAG: hypothetical protein RL112_1686 [Planctomycetota bacterium]